MSTRRPSRRWKIALALVALYVVLVVVQVPLWRWWMNSCKHSGEPDAEVNWNSWPSSLQPPGPWSTAPDTVHSVSRFGYRWVQAFGIAPEYEIARQLIDQGQLHEVWRLHQSAHSSGWPFAACVEFGAERYPFDDALPASRSVYVSSDALHWPGLLANSAVFTTASSIAAWAPITAASHLRSHHRGKRNLCPTCAYPRGTSPICTECGHPFN